MAVTVIGVGTHYTVISGDNGSVVTRSDIWSTRPAFAPSISPNGAVLHYMQDYRDSNLGVAVGRSIINLGNAEAAVSGGIVARLPNYLNDFRIESFSTATSQERVHVMGEVYNSLAAQWQIAVLTYTFSGDLVRYQGIAGRFGSTFENVIAHCIAVDPITGHIWALYAQQSGPFDSQINRILVGYGPDDPDGNYDGFIATGLNDGVFGVTYNEGDIIPQPKLQVVNNTAYIGYYVSSTDALLRDHISSFIGLSRGPGISNLVAQEGWVHEASTFEDVTFMDNFGLSLDQRYIFYQGHRSSIEAQSLWRRDTTTGALTRFAIPYSDTRKIAVWGTPETVEPEPVDDTEVGVLKLKVPDVENGYRWLRLG